MKVALLTLGCRTNQAESFHIEQSLKDNGHLIVDLLGCPDVCIINTCTVTSRADYQSRQLINRALRNKVKVIITGCYSELNYDKLLKLKGDIEIFRNTDKSNIIKQFNKLNSGCSSSCEIDCNTACDIGRHRPIVKVQDGCNFACTYCTIPIARGKSRSIAEDEIINQINSIEAKGYNEVVLTGIHLGTYGLDFTLKKSISELLEQILLNTKIPRIRLSSIEVNEIDDKLLELFGDSRICKHLHIPLQSGDDNILKLMNRLYTVKDFMSRLDKIISMLPGIGLGTDVIVGFPGEGEKEFINTKNLIESAPFSYLHIFPFSIRPAVRAKLLPNHIPEPVKKIRAAELRNIGKAKRQAFIEGNIGRTLDVIIENRVDNGYTGTTGNYIKAFIGCDNTIEEGMLANISIIGYLNGMAAGIPMKTKEPSVN